MDSTVASVRDFNQEEGGDPSSWVVGWRRSVVVKDEHL